MANRNQRAGKAIAAAFALLAASAVILWVAPLPIAAQGSRTSITIIYGDGKKLVVRDWNFVYAFMEDDNEAYLAICMQPSGGEFGELGCPSHTKLSTDLLLVEPSAGPNTALQEPIIFRKEDLQAIRIRWKTNNLGIYERDGLTLNRNRSAPRYESEGITVVTTQGTEHHFSERLLAPDAFLSDKKYVYLMSISIAGRAQAQVLPDFFGIPLDGRFTASSPKERIEEIRFR